jgi:hypothetical protein
VLILQEEPANRPEGASGGRASRGKEPVMTLSTIALTPLISLVAGVLILIMPRLLNYIVAIYLIVAGLLGLFPNLAG